MELGELKQRFKGLTGFEPMPWQARLYLEYFNQGRLPAAADIPTGLGKTAVTALWLIAIREGKCLPRRLVYVVDRRAVVDQATAFVEGVRERLPEGERLAISTLRGKHADNREWLDDPAEPAIIVGTVDMIGSRLLFEGYGVSRRMRPYHAGLLGADTLVVLDEAHLVPPFERLLEDIETNDAALAARDEADRSLIPRLRLLSLSATGRERKGEVFRLAEEDVAGCVLTRRRLNAVKRLTVREGDEKNLAEQLADAAWSLTESGTRSVRCLVYCNSRDQAEKVCVALERQTSQRPKEAGLPEVETELFVGARRGHEREAAARRLRELGFVAGSDPQDGRVRFVVATSAGEVGVDLDADHMACDLVAWERMVQRLGRVNRRGEGEARVVVVDAGPDASKLTPEAHAQLRALLDVLPPSGDARDASPEAIRHLKQSSSAGITQKIEQATTPAPLRPALTRPLLDAWSMTTLREHTGRPEVAPWLRGWVDEESHTVVVWRRHLPVPEDAKEGWREKWVKDATAYFEATPVHVNEQLESETWRVVDWLATRTKRLIEADRKGGAPADEANRRVPDPEAIIGIALSSAGDVSGQYTLQELAVVDKKRLQRELAGKTLVVDVTVGGLSKTGTLDPKEDMPPGWLGDVLGIDEDIDESGEPQIRWRVMRLEGDEEPEPKPGWRPRFRLVLARNSDAEATIQLAVYKWKQAAATEDDRAIGNAQGLDAHQNQAARRAREIGQRLSLPDEHVGLLELAARLHDEGKRAERWQRAFSAPREGRPYAKTRGPVNVHLLDGYRHEFGSLFYAEQDPEFRALPEEQQDLVLHLVAAHHGNARPTISIRGCDQAPPSVLEARAREVALRFARLQRRWGPWGLAWWEALLRAADQQASKDNERGVS